MVASSLDVDKEASVTSKEEVNSSSYVGFHNAQMFEDGLSFSGNERNKTWLNVGDGFADLSDLSGADTPNDSRAVIAADFDDDGDPDLFVHSIQRERHALYRNDAVVPGAGAGYLKLRLRATTSQYEAIGATVIVHGPHGETAQVLSRGAAFVSSQPPELVFGLGEQESALVDVIWPGTGGERESFGSVPAGSRATLVEGSGVAETFAARPLPLPDPLPPGLLLEEGDVLPRISLANAAGERVVLDVAQLADGKPVLLNFWASYCAPCVKELPLLQQKHAQGEVRVIALSLDVAADVPTARELLQANDAGFAAYFLPDGGEPLEGASEIGDLVDLERFSIPTTLVLSREGRLETILRGPLSGH